MRSFRSLVVSVLALWKGWSQKELAGRAGLPQKQVSYYLTREKMQEEMYRLLLAALQGRPAQVAAVTQCLETLDALEQEEVLTPEEQDEVEAGVTEGARQLRAFLRERALRSREAPALDGYPPPGDLEPARWQAGEQWRLLADLPEEHRLAIVQVAREVQSWALAERVAEESAVEASRDLVRAAGFARLAQEIAARVRGPEGWRRRLHGLVAGHSANVLRVSGQLKAARATMEEAKRLWQTGSDPDQVLDPGRLLDLEASLCRDERRFEQAMTLLDEAGEVSRCPARILIKKGFLLEVTGQYERAVATLREAEPQIDQRAEPRLFYMLRFNLAVNACHICRYDEAHELVERVRELALDLGDQIFLIRVTWLDGRIAAGLGRTGQALEALEQARREFAARKMWYDAALALLEMAALLLADGRTAEVKRLAAELHETFEAEGVHREALAALRLFHQAAEREEATTELAHQILAYLYRARYDQGLPFTSL